MLPFYSNPGYIAPWTHIFSSMNTFQHHPVCKDFEFRLADCVEAYGWYRSLDKCQALFRDLDECVYHLKRNKRLQLIQEERRRQKDRAYIPTPHVDVF